MKSRIKRLLLVVLVFNLSLVALTVALSFQAMHEHPMQGELVASGDYQLHVIDSGTPADADADADAATIVLIHGASTSALDFSTNLHPALATDWRVLSIDRPGHGYSERGPVSDAHDPARQAAMILDALHTLDINNPVLVGHSWAGSVVMAALLTEHPHVSVKAGVLIAGATHPWEGDSAWHVELSARPILGDIFRWQYISPLGRLSLEEAVQSVFTPEAVPENYIQNTGLKLSLRPATYKHNSVDRTKLSPLLSTQSQRYPTISQPLLSIAGSDDSVVPAWNHHDRLVQQIDQLQSLVVEGAGHAPHQTRPELIADTIAAFVRSLNY